MLDSETIRIVLAVHGRGSQAAAARDLHFSPGALSRRLAALEAAVGGPVFIRRSRGAELTELGRRYLYWAQRAQHEFDQLPSMTDSEAGAEVLRIGVLGAVLGETWAPIREEFHRRWPDVRLAFVPIDARNHDTAVGTGEVDLAVLQITGAEEPELETWVTTSSPRAVVVPRSSDLADAGWLTPADVSEAGLWLYAASRGRLAAWMDDLPVADAPRDTVITDPERVCWAVETTGRIAVHSMAARVYETPATRFVELAGRPARLGVMVRRGDDRPALRTLYGLARLCHANLGALDDDTLNTGV